MLAAAAELLRSEAARNSFSGRKKVRVTMFGRRCWTMRCFRARIDTRWLQHAIEWRIGTGAEGATFELPHLFGRMRKTTDFTDDTDRSGWSVYSVDSEVICSSWQNGTTPRAAGPRKLSWYSGSDILTSFWAVD
jgi:hypothetical protein